jgi:poly [ADP-ribose] polymerase 2/3/4
VTATTFPTGEPAERRKFQLTNLDGNNNKFWMIEVWPAGAAQVHVRTTYGRVGTSPQVRDATLRDSELEARIREKLRKGYQEVALHRPEVIVAPSNTPARTINPRVSRVVDLIFAEAGEKIASYLSVGVDALGQEQIERGRRLLDLAQRQHADWRMSQSQATFALLAGTVQSYYNAVPTQLPGRIDRQAVVEQFCADFDEQEDRLNQLEAAIATYAARQVDPDASPYDALGAELTPIPQSDRRYGEIVDYVDRTSAHGYHVHVRDIFAVSVPGERAAWDRSWRGRHNTALLFHGTAGQNVRHILRSGLICPRTASHGRMFGHGIYFAKRATKSTNYCSTRRAGVPNFLFLAEVALGDAYVAPDALPTLRSAPSGYDSVHGKAGHTGAWGGKLQYDEFIVYEAAQQTLRYLVTFER